ncbi:MAG: hypothetical protein ACI841_003408 [Planctomycetota bacterium]|jgi:hypothetical protein
MGGMLCLFVSSAAAQGAEDCRQAQPITGDGSFSFDNSTATQDGAPNALCDFFGSSQIEREL